MVAPLGPVYQAGTLCGNPLAMAAGLATLLHAARQPRDLRAHGAAAPRSLVEHGRRGRTRGRAWPLTANRVGSMFTWFFTDEPVTDWNSAAKCDTAAFGRFHRAMLNAGV